MAADFDVIILGYGPVGAVLANVLGADGLKVAVVDRMVDIYDKPRAINIDHEVMRLLQSVNLGKAVLRICSHHTGADFRGLDGRLIKVLEPMQPPHPLGWPPNLMFVQPEFEALLRSGVARFDNVAVLLGHEAVGLAQDEDEVRLEVRAGAEAERTLRGRYLVACDGAASFTRRQLAIGQESLDFDEWWTVVDAWLKRPTALPERTTQLCLPSGPTTYVVGPRGLRRWEIKLLPGESPDEFADPAVVRRRLSPLVDLDAIELWRIATYRFHALLAREWRRGRVLLAGDAAHQMPPFMAQGLCSGVRDVANLAWKLTGVLRHGLPAALLDSYEEERRPHVRRLVEVTKELGLIIGELDPERARARDEALVRELESGTTETVRQKLVPDLAGGIIALAPDGRPAPGAGTLAPQPSVRRAGGRPVLLDVLVGTRFLLLSLGAAPQDWLSPEAAATWRRLDGGRLILAPDDEAGQDPAMLVEEGTLLRDWMRAQACAALIVRPDRYVFGVAADPASLNRQIEQIAQRLGI